MRKVIASILTFVMILSLISPMLPVQVLAGTEYLMNIDFEKEPYVKNQNIVAGVSALKGPGGIDGWTKVTGLNSSDVFTPFDHPITTGGNAAKISIATSNRGVARFFDTGKTVASGIITFSFDFSLVDTDAVPANPYTITLFENDAALNAKPSGATASTQISIFPNGNVGAGGTGNGSGSSTIATVPVGKWYRINAEYDIDTSKATYTVKNGADVVKTIKDIAFTVPANGFSGVRIDGTSSTLPTATLHIDNIRVFNGMAADETNPPAVVLNAAPAPTPTPGGGTAGTYLFKQNFDTDFAGNPVSLGSLHMNSLPYPSPLTNTEQNETWYYYYGNSPSTTPQPQLQAGSLPNGESVSVVPRLNGKVASGNALRWGLSSPNRSLRKPFTSNVTSGIISFSMDFFIEPSADSTATDTKLWIASSGVPFEGTGLTYDGVEMRFSQSGSVNISGKSISGFDKANKWSRLKLAINMDTKKITSIVVAGTELLSSSEISAGGISLANNPSDLGKLVLIDGKSNGLHVHSDNIKVFTGTVDPSPDAEYSDMQEVISLEQDFDTKPTAHNLNADLKTTGATTPATNTWQASAGAGSFNVAKLVNDPTQSAELVSSGTNQTFTKSFTALTSGEFFWNYDFYMHSDHAGNPQVNLRAGTGNERGISFRITPTAIINNGGGAFSIALSKETWYTAKVVATMPKGGIGSTYSITIYPRGSTTAVGSAQNLAFRNAEATDSLDQMRIISATTAVKTHISFDNIKIYMLKSLASIAPPLPSDWSNIKLTLDSQSMTQTIYSTTKYKIPVAPQKIKDTVYFPFRTMVEYLGGRLDWNGTTQEVTAKILATTIKFKLGSDKVSINGAGQKAFATDSTDVSIFKDGEILVPIDFFKDEGNFSTGNFYFWYDEEETQATFAIPSPSISAGRVNTTARDFAVPTPLNPTSPVQLRFFVSSDSQGTDSGYTSYINKYGENGGNVEPAEQLSNGVDDGVNRYMTDVLKQMDSVTGRKFDFIVGIGDLVSGVNNDLNETDGPRKLKWELNNLRKRFTGTDIISYADASIPIEKFYPVMGNHEPKGFASFRKAFSESFPEFGANPNIHFAPGFDNIVWYADHDNVRLYGLTTNNPGDPAHEITNAQLAWLKNQVANTPSNITHNFFFAHEAFFSTWKFNEGQDRNIAKRNEVWKVIESTKNPMVFVGHEHLYSRRLIDDSFNETVLVGTTENSVSFDKRVYQLHVGGFGGGTNGQYSGLKNVISSPASIGLRHFAIVDVLEDGSTHVRVIAADKEREADVAMGTLLDDFIVTPEQLNEIYPKSVTIDNKDDYYGAGKTYNFTATVLPQDANDKSIIWASSNTSVATVSPTGVITAKAIGKALISATTTTGNKIAAKEINVVSLAPTPKDLVTTFVGDAKTSRGFTWYTSAGVDATVVEYEEVNEEDLEWYYVGANGDEGIKTATGTVNQLVTNVDARNIHKVEVTDLKPNTYYVYHVGDGTTWSDDLIFKTEAENVAKTTFIHIPDSQGGTSTYNIWGNLLTKALETFPATQFIAHTGDAVDTGSSEIHWKAFFDNAPQLKRIPIMPTIGNHEATNGGSLASGIPNFIGHFNLPKNGYGIDDTLDGTVYSYDYGDVHVSVLNTFDAGTGSGAIGAARDAVVRKQVAWLQKDIAKTNKKWKIVQMHKSPFGSYHTPTSVRDIFADEFDKLGIDVVLSGHDHSINITYPMLNKTAITNGTGAGQVIDGLGTMYVVSGHAGAKGYDDALHTQMLGRNTNTFWNFMDYQSFTAFEAAGNTLTIMPYVYSAGDKGIAKPLEKLSTISLTKTFKVLPNVTNAQISTNGADTTITWADPENLPSGSQIVVYDENTLTAPKYVAIGAQSATFKTAEVGGLDTNSFVIKVINGRELSSGIKLSDDVSEEFAITSVKVNGADNAALPVSGDATVTMTFKRQDGYNGGVLAILAVYDGSKMVALKSNNFTGITKKDDLKFEHTFNLPTANSENGYTLKAMLWEDFSALKLLTNVISR